MENESSVHSGEFKKNYFSKNVLRCVVSQKRVRFVDGRFDLDLSYITPQIIAMGLPGSKKFDKLIRNDERDVADMLNHYHPSRYLILNLSEKKYNYELFNHAVLNCGWPDHHPPSIYQLFEIINTMVLFLRGNPQNVVVVHCKAGKGRTGTLIVCLLIYCGLFDMDAALKYFAYRRGNSTSSKAGVTIPSQLRYIRYFDQILAGFEPTRDAYMLHAAMVHGVPSLERSAVKLVFRLFQNNTTEIYSADSRPLRLSADDDTAKLDLNVVIRGDILLRVDTLRMLGLGSESLCRCNFYTGFLDDTGMLSLGKADLDGAHKNDDVPDDFRIELIFSRMPGTAPTPAPATAGAARAPAPPPPLPARATDSSATDPAATDLSATAPGCEDSDSEDSEDSEPSWGPDSGRAEDSPSPASTSRGPPPLPLDLPPPALRGSPERTHTGPPPLPLVAPSEEEPSAEPPAACAPQHQPGPPEVEVGDIGSDQPSRAHSRPDAEPHQPHQQPRTETDEIESPAAPPAAPAPAPPTARALKLSDANYCPWADALRSRPLYQGLLSSMTYSSDTLEQRKLAKALAKGGSTASPTASALLSEPGTPRSPLLASAAASPHAPPPVPLTPTAPPPVPRRPVRPQHHTISLPHRASNPLARSVLAETAFTAQAHAPTPSHASGACTPATAPAVPAASPPGSPLVAKAKPPVPAKHGKILDALALSQPHTPAEPKTAPPTLAHASPPPLPAESPAAATASTTPPSLPADIATATLGSPSLAAAVPPSPPMPADAAAAHTRAPPPPRTPAALAAVSPPVDHQDDLHPPLPPLPRPDSPPPHSSTLLHGDGQDDALGPVLGNPFAESDGELSGWEEEA